MKKRLLFLLRAFNDLDHLAPVISTALHRGHVVKIIFTGDWGGDSYLSAYLQREGAKVIKADWLRWYHYRLRSRLRGSLILHLADLAFGFLPSVMLFISIRPWTIVVEWGGISGRGFARYILVPGRMFRVPTFSLPHGYHIWRNQIINEVMQTFGKDHKKFDFSERNRFSQVVVQSRNVKQFFLDRGVNEEKLAILGSPRFSEEWSTFNLKLALDTQPKLNVPLDQPLLLVFLGNWDYRINRDASFEMVRALGKVPGVNIVIKGHSRGDKVGGLLVEERDDWLSENIFYADDSIPSNVLIHYAAAVINYGSSIGIEAVVQRKPFCNSAFVTENTTIFDESGVTFDAHSVEDVVRFVTDVLESPDMTTMTDEARSTFLKEHVYADQAESKVLDSYLELLSGQAR